VGNRRQAAGDSKRRAAACAAALLLYACGASPTTKVQEAGPATGAPGTASVAAPKSVDPAPYVAGSSPGDVIARYIRPERSSRLAVPLPKGRARERWTAALDPKIDPAFVLSAGTRIVVEGRSSGSPTARHGSFVLLDTNGRRVQTGVIGGDLVHLRPAAGTFVGIGASEMPTAYTLAAGTPGPDALGPNDLRGLPGALAVRVASHEGTQVTVLRSGVQVEPAGGGGPRTVVEPPVEALDAAIDDEANLHVLVRQEKDLALWTTPLAGGSVGRVRIGPFRRDRADVPPILGGAVRVIVLDDRLMAFGRDGRLLWERKGALTGGATLTADDRLLIATDAKVLAIDPAGRATEIAAAPKEVFVTAPILTGGGLLVVATGSSVHAYTFE
jgi:hypothetical protein